MYCLRHCESSPGLRKRRRLGEGEGMRSLFPQATLEGGGLPFKMLTWWLLYYLSISLLQPFPILSNTQPHEDFNPPQ